MSEMGKIHFSLLTNTHTNNGSTCDRMWKHFFEFWGVGWNWSDLCLGVEHHVATRHGRAGGLAVVVQVTVLQVGCTILLAILVTEWNTLIGPGHFIPNP